MKKRWLIFSAFVVGGGAFALANLDPMLLQQELIDENGKIEKNLNQESGFDFFSDDSLQRFLDEKHAFSDLNYQPSDLMPINSDFTANNARKFQLRKEAGEKFADMAWHFQNENPNKKLRITSAFRSYAFQAKIAKSCSRVSCAKAGTSEHQAGLAVDLGINKGKIDKQSLLWLQNNAHKRGFHQSYQKGVEIDGIKVEIWHWRYLGEKLATELREKKMTFTEYFYSQNP